VTAAKRESIRDCVEQAAEAGLGVANKPATSTSPRTAVLVFIRYLRMLQSTQEQHREVAKWDETLKRVASLPIQGNLTGSRYVVTMHPNEELITRFYSAFAAGDHETMAACYSDEATFSDPVFPRLDAEQARAMWRMFCTGGNEIQVSFGDVEADERRGGASWSATYAFPKTGRRVDNEISAEFEFAEGKIVRHRDRFDLYRWTRMALGPLGLLLGWSPLVQNQVRAQASTQLKRFQARI
jgi:ketosteroid isomerase-like protein